tara:strand:- start:319 stop:603 length:285 start_codon:yes stop_codon:yes gene_type:complete
MNLEDYKELKRDIERQAEKDKTALLIKFVDLNNQYKIGDIVTDHIGSVRFDKLKYTTTGAGNIPTPIYIGIELKKDGTPKKRVVVRNVYGSNVL